MALITAGYGPSGPILDILVGVSQPLARAMRSKGLPVPPGIRLSMIVDTGADSTLVNEQHMRTLGLGATSTRGILTSTSKHLATQCDVFGVELRTTSLGDEPLIIPAIEVLSLPLFNHSIDGMLGRDFLNRVTLFVDGPARRFRIEY